MSDDRAQSPNSDLGVVGNGNGERAVVGALLHDYVAAAPPHFDEAVVLQDLADLAPRENPKDLSL